MGIEIGKIINSFIGKNLDSEIQTQLFQTELAEKEDGQTIEELHIPGFQYRPESNARIFVSRITRAWKIAIGIDDFVPKVVLEEGAVLLYSSAGGVIKAKFLLNPDGKFSLGNGTDELLSLVNDNLTEVIISLKFLRDTITFSNGGGPTGPPTNGTLLDSPISNLEVTQTALGNILI